MSKYSIYNVFKNNTPAATFSEGLLVKNQLQQQQKTVMEDETEVKVKVLNDHIVRLGGKAVISNRLTW